MFNFPVEFGARCKMCCSEEKEGGNWEGGREEKKGTVLEFPPHAFQPFLLIKSKGSNFFFNKMKSNFVCWIWSASLALIITATMMSLKGFWS